jgi:catechol 2,3-dioxygenase-like lactoylglutathione lyase family enzyme
MKSTAMGWPAELPVSRVRIARPTDRLGEVVRFYRDGLGLPELGSFRDHAGYSGVFIGLPGEEYHLELTEHEEGRPCPAPSKDNLLVLYFRSVAEVDRLAVRLAGLGHPAVPSENPYWETVEDSVTVEDPDGWRVVLIKPSGGVA